MNNVHLGCFQQPSAAREDAPSLSRMSPILPIETVLLTRVPPVPSMFGRDLIEQVQADSKGEHRFVPVIVEKCIEAVEILGMLSQTKARDSSTDFSQLWITKASTARLAALASQRQSSSFLSGATTLHSTCEIPTGSMTYAVLRLC